MRDCSSAIEVQELAGVSRCFDGKDARPAVLGFRRAKRF